MSGQPQRGRYFGDNTTVNTITLNGDSITVTGSGATVEGSTVTIQSAGTYSLSGTLTDGQILVDTEDQETVTLILNGVDLHSSTSAPLYIASAEETVIVLADDTQNNVSDAATYVFEDPEEDEPNAAIFSKDDLTIDGGGSLAVTGSYNDGITSKDSLTIVGGTIIVNAVDDGWPWWWNASRWRCACWHEWLGGTISRQSRHEGWLGERTRSLPSEG